MNILKTKRQEFANDLAKLTALRKAKIDEKVAAYRASLEAEKDEMTIKLRTSIEAIDVLLANTSEAFEYELVEDDYEAVEDEHEAQLSIPEEIEEDVSNEETDDNCLAECFRRKTVLQRPGMQNIAIPTRH